MTPEEMEALLRSIAETQEQIGATLLKMNSAPNVATEPLKGIEDQATPPPVQRRWITPEEREQMYGLLRQKSNTELYMLFSRQARQRNTGIPLDAWLNTAGYAAQMTFEGIRSQVDVEVQKALDVTGATPLIRQDLEPILYEVFVRLFPAYERFGKEPANGLTHAWNQITAYGDAKFMAELGTVTDDTSTYERKTTNVAILATRRGISLKSQFAVMAGGMNYNPEQIELQGGLRAIAHKMQKTIFEGQLTVTSGTSDNEFGPYDADGFTGLRHILNTANAINLDPATDPTTTGSFRRALDAGVLPITQVGGAVPTIFWGHPQEKITFDEQQDVNVRLVGPNYVDIGVGATAQRVNTYAGQIPFGVVPGDSIASYHSAAYGGNLVRDLYLLEESGITLPYLGTPGPTVLEIPIGISGQLTHLYIVFLMNGLAVKVMPWHNKIRVKVAA
ncbi:MAG TPA: hypothetical protein VIU29_03140 [Candidatus Deferrimicrobiaceae bacterium]